MAKLKNIILQCLLYGIFIMLIAFFSTRPVYTHHDPAMALIKLSFSHAGSRKEECRRLTPEELAKLAPNMRRPLDCKRERVPVFVEIFLDDEVLFRDYLQPGGLSHDGASTVYQRFPTRAGEHSLVARLRDSRREQGFDYIREGNIKLSPNQNFVIDFNPDIGGFVFL